MYPSTGIDYQNSPISSCLFTPRHNLPPTNTITGIALLPPPPSPPSPRYASSSAPPPACPALPLTPCTIFSALHLTSRALPRPLQRLGRQNSRVRNGWILGKRGKQTPSPPPFRPARRGGRRPDYLRGPFFTFVEGSGARFLDGLDHGNDASSSSWPRTVWAGWQRHQSQFVR